MGVLFILYHYFIFVSITNITYMEKNMWNSVIYCMQTKICFQIRWEYYLKTVLLKSMDNTPNIISQKYLNANIGFFVKNSKHLTNCIQTKMIQCKNE